MKTISSHLKVSVPDYSTCSWITFPLSKVNFELDFGCHFVLGFSECHVIKLAKIVSRNPAFARVAAILKLVEEKALGRGCMTTCTQ